MRRNLLSDLSTSDAVVSNSPYIQRSFENMRRILDERTSIANVLVQKSRLKEPSEIKSVSSAETRDVMRHPPGAERKISLSEIRNSLAEQQIRQIVRISEERFPAGLRWHNTIRQSDVQPTTVKGRTAETPGSTVLSEERRSWCWQLSRPDPVCLAKFLKIRWDKIRSSMPKSCHLMDA